MHNITRKVEFDAAHRIPNHDSKCKNVHGHRYVLECTVAGKLIDKKYDSSEGMIIDFGMLKQLMVFHIAEPWDHALLVYEYDKPLLSAINTLVRELDGEVHKHVILPCIPTVENLAKQAFEILEPGLDKRGIQLTNVRLYETPNCWADYNRS